MSSVTIYQQTPKMEVSGGGCLDSGFNILSSYEGPSKGVIKCELRKSGTPLASSRQKLDDDTNTDIITIGTGVEGDNGSTDKRINYLVDATDYNNGLYTVYFELSGNVDGWTAGGGNSLNTLVRGVGHCEFEAQMAPVGPSDIRVKNSYYVIQ